METPINVPAFLSGWWASYFFIRWLIGLMERDELRLVQEQDVKYGIQYVMRRSAVGWEYRSARAHTLIAYLGGSAALLAIMAYRWLIG
jgi:hypothetical protein